MIDKEYAILTLRTMEYDFDSERVALNMAIKALENERPKGNWKRITPNVLNCTNCKKNVCDVSTYMVMNFCPNCGADMRERSKDES